MGFTFFFYIYSVAVLCISFKYFDLCICTCCVIRNIRTYKIAWISFLVDSQSARHEHMPTYSATIWSNNMKYANTLLQTGDPECILWWEITISSHPFYRSICLILCSHSFNLFRWFYTFVLFTHSQFFYSSENGL